jgi:hypothetical protein
MRGIMSRPLVIIILLLTSVQVMNGEIEAVLKDSVYIKKDSISLNDLVNSIPKNNVTIPIITNCFFSNREIQLMLNRIGIKDAVLIGSGTYILKTDNLTPSDYLRKYISLNYKDFDLSNFDFKAFNMPDDLRIIRITANMFSNFIRLNMECVKFDGDTGGLTNCTFDLYYNGNAGDNNCLDMPEQYSTDGQFLENIDGGHADLIYKKGNISIMMKVRIVRILEDKTFLVENYKSGKIFKVKLKDSL